MKQRNTMLRVCVIGTLTFALVILALWNTGNFPPAAYANSGGGVTYRTLTKCTPTGGTISNSPTGTTFVNNTVVTLTASADPGFVFTGWTGALSGTTNPINLTMNANKSVCATFKPRLDLYLSYYVAEGTMGGFSVKLSAPSSSTVTVQYDVTGGTATGGGVDYTFQAGTLTFAPGDQSESVQVPITLDGIVEPNESIEFSLSNPTNAVLGNTPRTCLIGSPPPPSVRFEAGSSTIAESAGTAVIPVDIWNYGGGGTWGVQYRISGTATYEQDYDEGVPLIFDSLQDIEGAAIEIPIIDDAFDEGDETIILTLKYSDVVPMSPSTHILTIVDDDDEPLVAAFEAEPRVGTAPLEVEFTDTSTAGLGAIVGWEWDFGDGSGSTVQHPTHTYDEPGAYTVSLTVETGDGEDTEVRADYIQVGGEGAFIAVSPSLIQFGHVPVGHSKIVPVTIRNDGDETLTGTAVVEAPFSIDGDAAYAIPPEGETFLNVVYTPTAAVASYDVIGLPGGGNAQVALYGSAIAPESEDAAGVRLNELVVWNTSGVVSANGEYVDWIELYNENDYALDISGWTLTDDDGDPDKYMLPPGTIIGPNGYLLVYASTETASLLGEMHTGFALDEVNGGYVGLFAPVGGTPTLMSQVEYPVAEEEDSSYGVMDDENKQLVPDMTYGIPTPLLFNKSENIWNLWVYVVPSLENVGIELLPDPTKDVTDHTEYSFITIYDWLPIVKNYTSQVFQSNKDETITSPVNTGTSVTIPSDVSIKAGVNFQLHPQTDLVHVVTGMPLIVDGADDVYRTANSVPDGTLVVCADIQLLKPNGEIKRAEGLTLLSVTKKVIFVAALQLDLSKQIKWHSNTFAHELGHYVGIIGHMEPRDGTMLMDVNTLYPYATPPESRPEPWFFVAATKNAKRYFEGQKWSSEKQRRHNPPKATGMTDSLPDDDLQYNEQEMQSVFPQTWSP